MRFHWFLCVSCISVYLYVFMNVFARFFVFLCPLGALGRSWGALGHSWKALGALLGRFWSGLGPSGSLLGRPWGALGSLLGPCWTRLAKNASQEWEEPLFGPPTWEPKW